MKTFTKIFIAFLFVFWGKANAQITLLKTTPPSYYAYDFQSVYLKHSGFKFVFFHSDSLTLYNLNLSLFTDIKIPGNWNFKQSQVECISEGLFDTNTLHIDYVMQNPVADSMVIYQDNGNIVFRKDSAILVGNTVNQSLGFPLFYPIIATDSGTYMIIDRQTGTTQLYKLPGSFPCIPTCSGNNVTSISPIYNNTSGEMSIYPNPAVSYTNIYYTLPQGASQGQLILYDLAGRVLKEYTVTSVVDHLRLTTSDIAAGTYFYQLSVNGNAVAAKKIVVVK